MPAPPTPSRRVLDLGSGHHPHPEATHLADLFVTEDAHRGNPIKLDGRPFVWCAAETLPFKDDSFDAVILSHILEHAQDPEKALAEATRIAKRGYLETPGYLIEKLYGGEMHLWFVSAKQGRPVFVRKPGPGTTRFHWFHSKFKPWRLFIRGVDFLTGTGWVRCIWVRDGKDLRFKKIRSWRWYGYVLRRRSWQVPLFEGAFSELPP